MFANVSFSDLMALARQVLAWDIDRSTLSGGLHQGPTSQLVSYRMRMTEWKPGEEYILSIDRAAGYGGDWEPIARYVAKGAEAVEAKDAYALARMNSIQQREAAEQWLSGDSARRATEAQQALDAEVRSLLKPSPEGE